jgi:general secretion pathway protein D
MSVAPQIFKGSGSFVETGGNTPTPASRRIVSGDAVTLDFANVDVRDVVRSVLGDLLRVPYVIDPSVQGTVTLQTGTALPRASVLPALQDALRLSGVALVDSDGIVNVVPLANAARGMRLNEGGTAGFVARVVTPQYVAVADLQRALEPLVPPGCTVRADPSRNALIVTGPTQGVASVLNNISVFDVDYLKGMSFALLPLRNAQAAVVTKEVSTMLASAGAATAGLVRVIPIERLNAILVTAMVPAYIDRVRSWVDRFDSSGMDSDQQRLYVYRVQNGRAIDLAAVLHRALGIDATTVTGSASAGAGSNQPADVSRSSASIPGVASSTPVAGRSVPGASSGSAGGDQTAPSSQSVPDIAGSSAPGADQSAGSDIRVTADDSNNALLVLATGQEYAWLETALAQLDVPPLQVMIEAVVAEVDLTDQLAYGLQYYVKSGNFQALFAAPSGSSSSSGTGQTTGSAFPGFGFASGLNLAFASNSGSAVILQALQQLTTVSVLSSPNLLVLNNQTAKIQVGDQVPISTQSATGVLAPGSPIVNSIEYRDTGVILQVKPRVNASGNVMLDVSQEVSDVSTTTSSSLDTPTISERRINSTIVISDGETIALGGLIKDTRSNAKNGIPFLQDIPVLGALFGTRNNSLSRTEVIVLITPHVIRDPRNAQAVTDEIQRKLSLTAPVVGIKAPGANPR